MTPIPTTIELWQKEVREAYALALRELGKLKPPEHASVAFSVAPLFCAKFRKLSSTDERFATAYDDVMHNYDVMLLENPEMIELSQTGFAYAYVVTHCAYGLVSEKMMGEIMAGLAAEPELLLPARKAAPSAKKKSTAAGSAKQTALIALTAKFCGEFLNAEYAALCQKLIEKAGRKRVVPFESGMLESWAAGVVHAICTVNFAFDKTQTPHTNANSIAAHFGVSMNTASSKSKALRALFKMTFWDSEFATAEMAAKSPVNYMRVF